MTDPFDDSEFADKEEAYAAYQKAKAEHEWPVRVIKSIQLGSGPVVEYHDELNALSRELRKLRRSCVVNIIGGRRCLLCGEKSEGKEKIRHTQDCPLKGVKP